MKVLSIALVIISLIGIPVAIAHSYCGPKPEPTEECEDWIKVYRGTVCTWDCVPRQN